MSMHGTLKERKKQTVFSYLLIDEVMSFMWMPWRQRGRGGIAACFLNTSTG
jgi:hypothetical protein